MSPNAEHLLGIVLFMSALRLNLPMQHSITSHNISIQGRTLHYLKRTGIIDNSPTLVLFHGFPENAYAWNALINALPHEYHIIAPDLPGYHKSEPLNDPQSYSVPSLIRRMGEFVQTICHGRKVILVGHDWGGAIAWPLAAFQPHLFEKLIILNAAHPSTFTQAMKVSSVQRRKSEYIKTLIADDAEAQLRRSDFAMFKQMLGHQVFANNNEYGARLLADWNQPHTLTAMLNYYREMPQTPPGEHATSEVLDGLKVPEIRISLPTLVLWGCQDDAFDESVLDNLKHYVPQLRIVYHTKATHWVHREQAEWVAKEIEFFVQQNDE